MEERIINQTPNEFIPSFDELYIKTIEYVKAHQGEKGFIDTQVNKGNDKIYGISYNFDEGFATEQYVYGVRVRNEDGEDDLQVLLEPICLNTVTVYQDEDFQDDMKWESIRYSDVYYIHTLLAVAESIDEYVDE